MRYVAPGLYPAILRSTRSGCTVSEHSQNVLFVSFLSMNILVQIQLFFITSLLGWQLTHETKKLQIKIWWMTATERNLLCMTDSSMSRNAVVVSEVVKKMHIRGN